MRITSYSLSGDQGLIMVRTEDGESAVLTSVDVGGDHRVAFIKHTSADGVHCYPLSSILYWEEAPRGTGGKRSVRHAGL